MKFVLGSSRRFRAHAVGAAAALTAFGTGTAHAGYLPDNIEIRAQVRTDTADAGITVRLDETHFDPASGSYHWSLSEPLTLESGGHMLGEFEQITAVVSGVRGTVQPTISLAFIARTEMDSATFLFELTADFDLITGLHGRASAQAGASDFLGDGVALSAPDGAGGKLFTASLNHDTNPTVFASLVDSQSAGPFASSSDLEEFPGATGFAPFGVGTTSMRSAFEFELSGGSDVATGTSIFTAVPEPSAALCVLALGCVGLRRVRGR